MLFDVPVAKGWPTIANGYCGLSYCKPFVDRCTENGRLTATVPRTEEYVMQRHCKLALWGQQNQDFVKEHIHISYNFLENIFFR